MNFVIADGRWSGQHGIGRFSKEVLSRLQNVDIIERGPHPLSFKNLFWQTRALSRFKKKYKLYFSPGFNPVLFSPIPFILTIHDLIHLLAPGNGRWAKKFFYHALLKPSIHRAYKILTVSEYSKKTIIEWANIPHEKVINVSCGVSEVFVPQGKKHEPGFPYFLHVGNNVKSHKNVLRLLQAFSLAKIDHARLILTSQTSNEINQFIEKNKLSARVIFKNGLTESELAEYYRGACGLLFPSLFEGFGLPVLESMACGTPVLTSNVTSLPEVASDAALLIDPFDIEAIRLGIEKLFSDDVLRAELIQKGLQRAKFFSWDKTAASIGVVLKTHTVSTQQD